jgi:hypothetical protein
MTKFMIQDIVPPNRKRVHAGKKPTHSDPVSEKPDRKVAAPSHTPASAHLSHAVEETIPHHSFEGHKDPEIEDMLPENPRSMILEHLYEDNTHVAENPLTHVESDHVGPKSTTAGASGAWPYNDKKPETAADPERRIPAQFPTFKTDGASKSGWIPWILIPALLLVASFFVFDHFARVNVLIIPKNDVIPMEGGESFSALKSPSAEELGFAVMKVVLEDSIEVAATGTKAVTAKASGRVVVYNEQTTAQRLIKNTRFQSVAGKIYRINESIDVPKATTPKGGKLTPGTLEVTVYADEAGPDYNADPTDFTVPGLKGLPQYTKVYARSKGALSGGASGTIKSVSDQDLRQASDDLRVSLETKLRSKAHGDLAPSQIGYDKGIVVELTEPKLSTTKASREDRAVVTASGILYYVVFDRPQLTAAIAKALIPTYAGEQVAVENLDSLQFSMPTIRGDALWASEKISFELSGSPSLVWIVDEETVKESLVSIPKSNFNAVMGQFTTIERAKGVMRPFWKTTYPEDPDGISVEIVERIDE